MQPKCSVCRWPEVTIRALGHHAAGCRERRIRDAAPEIYDALRMATDALISLAPYPPELAEGVIAFVEIARAALRKADGDE